MDKVTRLTEEYAGNMGLLQAGLTQELPPLTLSITFGAWRQVSAFKPRLQQALKRYKQTDPTSTVDTLYQLLCYGKRLKNDDEATHIWHLCI